MPPALQGRVATRQTEIEQRQGPLSAEFKDAKELLFFPSPQTRSRAFRKPPRGRDPVEGTLIFTVRKSPIPRSNASEFARGGGTSGGNHDSTK